MRIRSWLGACVAGLLAVPLLGPPLAADSITQVISNTTVWIVGILAGLATLMLTDGYIALVAANAFADPRIVH